MGFPCSSVVKNSPAMQEAQETWIWSLVWEDPLKMGMATHFCILGWKTPQTEEPGGQQSTESKKVEHNEMTEHMHA